MIVSGTNLYMTRGDTEHISVKLNGYELKAGDKVELTVRRTVVSEIMMHKEVTEFSDNSALILIAPEDTSSAKPGRYVYDVQLTFDGVVKTVVPPSTFEIGWEVTYG